MLTENAKFKHHRTDKTVVHESNEPNVLIINRKLIFLLGAPRMQVSCW